MSLSGFPGQGVSAGGHEAADGSRRAVARRHSTATANATPPIATIVFTSLLDGRTAKMLTEDSFVPPAMRRKHLLPPAGRADRHPGTASNPTSDSMPIVYAIHIRDSPGPHRPRPVYARGRQACPEPYCELHKLINITALRDPRQAAPRPTPDLPRTAPILPGLLQSAPSILSSQGGTLAGRQVALKRSDCDSHNTA
jgi:hypothetical protein